MRMTMFCKRVTLLLTLSSMLPQMGVASGFYNADRDKPLQIPINDEAGQAWKMQGHICRPDGIARPRLVIINHGSPPKADDRPGMKLADCHSEAVLWFLRHHYAVALVTRLGYGATGGPWTEGYNGCANADYYRAGMETARQIQAMVDYLVTLPDIDPNDVVVVGQSAGGWGTLAYDSMPHPHVSALISMAGGRGGHYRNQPNNNCHPEKLIEAASRFGKTASTPMLWIYAKNDSYFNPQLAAAMFQAFTQAGGKAEYAVAPSFGEDGHHLFFGRDGSEVWGRPVDAYIKQTADTAVP